ncbi:MAG: MoaD/ThiS family protein [Candidatus Odinarchaeota archaeon]|nr:MoaD/ThiS family protein [Candidatus Odinarchaeota archaeon]
MEVKVKVFGNRKGNFTLEFDERATVKDVFKRMISMGVLDSNPNEIFNFVVLVNDIEISALRGEKTRLREGDRLVFIPVIHGG